MRVIAGSARGTRLAAPPGLLTRPTADRVRESLFSIVSSRMGLADASVLDICAGTGALGIEALSRGASRCCFVETDVTAMQVIKKNLIATRFSDKAELMHMDALKALGLLGKRGSSFDVVFFDPPYASRLYDSVPNEICRLPILAVDGLVIIESSSFNVLPERIAGLVKVDRRIYGDTALELYAMEEI